MSRLLAIKILQAIPVLLLVSVLAFLLMSLLPGDPAVVIAGDQASPEAIEKVRLALGLDRPFLEQIALWFGQLVQGNFGNSLMLNQSVLSAMGERLPVTLSLAGLSLAITLPIGILVGSIAAYYRQTWVDSAVMSVALLGVSIPGFWIAILAVILFSVILGWLPSSGYVIMVITALGILVSTAIGGSVVIEQVFALPGIGRLVVQGILARDYPLVQGVMLIYGFAFVAVNLTVDILYTFADPRVRYD
jgi:peptide/nickel transport system permease protein